MIIQVRVRELNCEARNQRRGGCQCEEEQGWDNGLSLKRSTEVPGFDRMIDVI